MNAIRAATSADAEAMGIVHVLAWQAAYAEMMPRSYLDHLDPVERAAMWRQVLSGGDGGADRRSMLLVFEDDDCGLQGFAGAGPDRDGDPACGELYVVNVAPQAWGRGHGPALVSAAMAWLAERWDQSVLWVVSGNARARRCYERLGWSPDGGNRHDDVLGATVHEVRYRWTAAIGSGEHHLSGDDR